MRKKTVPANISTIFDDKIEELKANGKYVGMRDATEELHFTLTADDIANGNCKDQSTCPVALGTGRKMGEEHYMSIGDTVAKILNYKTGIVTRYGIPATLGCAISFYDREGRWPISFAKPGHYHLLIPSETRKLAVNQTKETRDKKRVRTEKTKSRIRRGTSAGGGWRQFHRSPIRIRQVTLLRK